jgi:predicted phage-related endonuclease
MSYLAQCHWYLLLTNLERCDLAVLFGNSELKIYQIHKDRELEATLLKQAIDFWENHVQKEIAPQPQTNSDYQTLFQKEVVGKKIEASEQTVKLIAHAHEINKQINAKEEALSQIKKHLMEQMGDAQELIYHGSLLATWKKPKTSYRFDSKGFAKDHSDLFSLYQMPISNSRRLLIKEPSMQIITTSTPALPKELS